jgi:hypothetical protein
VNHFCLMSWELMKEQPLQTLGIPMDNQQENRRTLQCLLMGTQWQRHNPQVRDDHLGLELHITWNCSHEADMTLMQMAIAADFRVLRFCLMPAVIASFSSCAWLYSWAG